MALTITQVTHPNAAHTEFSFGPFRARIVDISFDSSYPTGGETLTPEMLGWSELIGVMEIVPPMNEAQTLSLQSGAWPYQGDLFMQAFRAPADASDAPFDEVASTGNLSGYTGRYLVFGY
jgi:hypothetical protein